MPESCETTTRSDCMLQLFLLKWLRVAEVRPKFRSPQVHLAGFSFSRGALFISIPLLGALSPHLHQKVAICHLLKMRSKPKV